jgi:DNA-binding NtrC family response regulator
LSAGVIVEEFSKFQVNRFQEEGTHMAAATTVESFLPVQNRVLIASADPLFRKSLMNNAIYADAHCEEAVGGAHALAKLKHIACDNVLLDLNLPDLDSSELARLILKRYPKIKVGFIDSQMAQAPVEQMDLGEPSALGGGGFGAAFAGSRQAPHANLFASPEEPLAGMIGSSRAMQKVYRLVRMVAKRDTAVLITGETGTGKELVAEAIHNLSPRSRNPFVIINCAAIPEALFEAELFGHARGAFTGAIQSRPGRIHMAQGGTLFLDEIGELPLSMQVKLLRFLQSGEVQRLGSEDLCRVDVRVICATNVCLAELMQARQFRADLFYRMAVFPIVVPPLRERPEDLSALAAHFLLKFCADFGVPAKKLTRAALTLLERWNWAGNVRELQHVLERAFILSGSEVEIPPECFGEHL